MTSRDQGFEAKFGSGTGEVSDQEDEDGGTRAGAGIADVPFADFPDTHLQLFTLEKYYKGCLPDSLIRIDGIRESRFNL